MTDIDYESLLDTPATEIEKPKPLPQGDYTFVVVSWKQIESEKKGTPGVLVIAKPIEARETVDPDELELCKNWQSKELGIRYWLTQGSIFMLTEFLSHCGVELEGKSVREALADLLPGMEFIGHVSHAASPKDPDIIYAEIKMTAPVA